MPDADARSPPPDLSFASITPSSSSRHTRNCLGSLPGAGSTSESQSPYPDQVLENVLENVLHFLTCRHDRNSASLVCKSWYRAEAMYRSDLFIGNCYVVSPIRVISRFPRVRSIILKGKPRFADFNLMPPDWGAHFNPWGKAMSNSYHALEKVHLKRMSITDNDLVLLADSFLELKELVLVCCEGFGTTGLSVFVSKCRRLRVLDLVESDVADDEVDWISCFTQSCLESLVFDCIDCLVNFDALEKLVARCHSLKKLKVNRYVGIERLHRLIIRAPQLTHLGTGSFGPAEPVTSRELVPEYQSAFAACKSLVCLSGLKEIHLEYFPAIYPVCTNLTSLNFSYANISAEYLKPIISNCHKLQIFWVLDSIGDEGLELVATTCKELRELRVFPVSAQEDIEGPVSEIGFLAISEGCRNLESILYFCQRMTNNAVRAMSTNCPNLIVFRLCIMGLHRPDHLTNEPMDEGFGAIVKNCKKLTRLAVSGLLTDKAFSYIGEYGKLVRTLSVAFAGDSDMALKYIMEGCPRLEKLEIRDCPFGDAGLLSGLHHYYKMRFLWMSSCRLTSQGCQEVSKALPGLVVEVISTDSSKEKEIGDYVETCYIYRSLDGPRDDAPEFVTIL